MRLGMLAAAVAAAAVLGGCAPSAPHPTQPSPSAAAPQTSSSRPSTPPAPPTTAPATSSAAAEAARPAPPPNHCASNRAAQLVLVKLSVQHLWLCARTHTVYSSPITSGMLGAYTETPTGHYHVQGLDRNTVLTLNTGATYDVKYWIPFNAPLFGFHDSSWQKFPYGSQKYKTDGSHGCIHLPLKTIAFLYQWAHIGADVSIS